MYKVVLAVFFQFKVLTDKLPALAKAILNLQGNISEIERLQMQQSSDLTGATKDKDKLHDQLSETALSIAGAIFAHATDIGNIGLKTKVDFTASDFDNCSQSDFISHCSNVLTEARSLDGQLLEHGIVSERVAEFSDLIEQFKTIVTKPRELVVNRTTITDDIAQVFKNTDALLKEKLDKLMLQYKQSNPDFFQSYQNARSIIDHGLRHEKESKTTITQ
jgi:hypothetical protein